MVEQGAEHNLSGAALEGHVAKGVQDVQRFGDVEAYTEYHAKLGQLSEALEKTHGTERAGEMLSKARENIMQMGGQEMLNKFQTDPNMLDPAVITPFLKENPGESNPYLKYMQASPVAPVVPPAQPPQQPVLGNLEQVNARIAEMYSAENIPHQGKTAWKSEILNLFRQKNMLQKGQQGVA